MKSDEWKEVRLGDISNFSQGKQISIENQYLQKDDDLNRFLRIIDYTSIDEPKRYVNENSNKYYVNKDDIVIIRYGSKTAGKVVKGFSGIIANNLFRVNFKDKVNKTFIYYKLSEAETIKYFKNSQSSSTMPAITFDIVENLKLLLPPLPEQKAIADTLSCIDDKIENNNRINKVLEDMAQAIFKSWFIDFEPFRNGEFVDSELGMIPKGWRVGTIGEILENIKQSVKPGNHLNKIPYLPIDSIPMNKLNIDNYKSSKEALSSLLRFQKNDIIIGAMRVYFHRVVLSPFEGVTRSTCFILRPRIANYLYYSLILCNQKSTIEFANQTSKGSTMPYAIWEGGLSNMKILIPTDYVFDRFNNCVSSIINKLRDSLYEKLTLQGIRDTLLPKLMSGEIRVPYDEESQ